MDLLLLDIFSKIQIPFFGKVMGGQADYTWLVWCMIATFTVIIINAILLSIGHAFNMRELEAYSKSEMLQAGATVLIVVFLVLIVNGASVFAAQYFFGCSLTGDVLTCSNPVACGDTTLIPDSTVVPLEVLKCDMIDKAYLFDQINRQALNDAQGLMVLMSQYISILGIPIFQGGYVTSWFKQVESYRLVINLTVNLLIASNALVVVINYIKQNMLTFFLPLGLVLRAFQFTRGIGAFFIAIAIGFYFIFPIVFMISDPGFAKPSLPNTLNVAITNIACYPSFSGIAHNNFFDANNFSGSSTILSLQTLTSDLSLIYLSFILRPFIAFAITLIFVRYMMYMLGGEAQDLMRFVAKVV
ncbi:MAG: hypothetical protein Q7S22_06590 [Candidatus Micrarchaeota archaeon]|nr:hypothetical protein [Candidatus Micrarchaeota archaeon]